MPIRDIAIVGGGFSGALLAINLLRHEGPHATLIEPRTQLGPGVAYSTTNADHLLNVRAANMSAFPDQPDHFVRWLGDSGLATGEAFVPRAVYGRYLAGLLEAARERAPNRLAVVHARATALEQGRRTTIGLDTGDSVQADAAVLALGNLPPRAPGSLDLSALPAGSYIADPWTNDLAEGLDASDEVLILGTGLTMVDVALSLLSGGFRGKISAISRRGLVPLRHDPTLPPAHGLKERPAGELAALLRAVRERARTAGWRAAVDELRPYTQDMWLAATPAEQRRFLRHLRPWWDIHRHRLAPAVGERLDGLIENGTLRIAAGQVVAVEPVQHEIAVKWRPRGRPQTQDFRVKRLINCTGPQSDLAQSSEPLLVQLARSGCATAHPLGLGLQVDSQSRLVDFAGQPHRRLFALGPMTRGTFWEVTAVPDIRLQAWKLARHLSNAHWVGGEGL